MSTMNISLPESLKFFVDEQVTQRGYGTSSEYVRELIRKDADRVHLRALLLEGRPPHQRHQSMPVISRHCVSACNDALGDEGQAHRPASVGQPGSGRTH